MEKTRIAVASTICVVLVAALLGCIGCTPEPETTTVTYTSTPPAQTVTTTKTAEATTQTTTVTETQTLETTVYITSSTTSPATDTTPTTTAATSEIEIEVEYTGSSDTVVDLYNIKTMQTSAGLMVSGSAYVGSSQYITAEIECQFYDSSQALIGTKAGEFALSSVSGDKVFSISFITDNPSAIAKVILVLTIL